MNRRALLLCSLAIVTAPSFPGRAQTPEPTGPQPELPREKLVVVTRDGARHDFMVEMALGERQQTTGLMFRAQVPEGGGMLFDWGVERDSAMWMRNTITSLDMLFIRADGRIRAIAERTTPRSLAIISSDGPVRATLELAAGTAERLGISVGDRVEHRFFAEAAAAPR